MHSVEGKSNDFVYFNFAERPIADEFWLKIYSYLDSLQDLTSLALVNHQLSQIFPDNSNWKPFLTKHFPCNFPQYPTDRKESAIELYTFYANLQSNFKKGIYTLHTLDFQQEMRVFQIHSNRLFFIDDVSDGSIQGCDFTLNEKLLGLKAEKGGFISCLHVQGDYLFAGGCYNRLSLEGTLEKSCMVQIWDLKTLKLHGDIYTDLKGNISCLCVDGDNLFAGLEGELGVICWSLKTEEFNYKFASTGWDETLSLRARGNFLFIETFFDNCPLVIYNLDTCQVEKNPIRGGNVGFEFFENFCICKSGNEFEIWDIHNPPEIKKVGAFIDNSIIPSRMFQIRNGCLFLKDENKIHIMDFNPVQNTGEGETKVSPL